jgi:hypothetical protein
MQVSSSGLLNVLGQWCGFAQDSPQEQREDHRTGHQIGHWNLPAEARKQSFAPRQGENQSKAGYGVVTARLFFPPGSLLDDHCNDVRTVSFNLHPFFVVRHGVVGYTGLRLSSVPSCMTRVWGAAFAGHYWNRSAAARRPRRSDRARSSPQPRALAAHALVAWQVPMARW